MACINKTACRLPNDMVRTDFVTGKVEYPKYNCGLRNQRAPALITKRNGGVDE